MDERAAERDLYSDIYRCQSCSDLTDPDGVRDFAAIGPKQTVPVSHFGDISNSPIWLVLNNPANDRSDLAVGTVPAQFGAPSRATLEIDAVDSIKKRFDSYFNGATRIHSAFAPWIALLDGLELDGEISTFASGRICAVDLIKCPTARNWAGYVMRSEGKTVWNRCLRDADANRFLIRQIELHRPRVLVFAGTAGCVGGQWRGRKDSSLTHLAEALSAEFISTIWTHPEQERLSIGLISQNKIKEFDPDALKNQRAALQAILARWTSLHKATG